MPVVNKLFGRRRCLRFLMKFKIFGLNLVVGTCKTLFIFSPISNLSIFVRQKPLFVYVRTRNCFWISSFPMLSKFPNFDSLSNPTVPRIFTKMNGNFSCLSIFMSVASNWNSSCSFSTTKQKKRVGAFSKYRWHLLLYIIPGNVWWNTSWTL